MGNIEYYATDVFDILVTYNSNIVAYDSDGNVTLEPAESRKFYLNGDNILVSIVGADDDDGSDVVTTVYLGKDSDVSSYKHMINSLREVSIKHNVGFNIKKDNRAIRPSMTTNPKYQMESKEMDKEIKETVQLKVDDNLTVSDLIQMVKDETNQDVIKAVSDNVANKKVIAFTGDGDDPITYAMYELDTGELVFLGEGEVTTDVYSIVESNINKEAEDILENAISVINEKIINEKASINNASYWSVVETIEKYKPFLEKFHSEMKGSHVAIKEAMTIDGFSNDVLSYLMDNLIDAKEVAKREKEEVIEFLEALAKLEKYAEDVDMHKYDELAEALNDEEDDDLPDGAVPKDQNKDFIRDVKAPVDGVDLSEDLDEILSTDPDGLVKDEDEDDKE